MAIVLGFGPPSARPALDGMRLTGRVVGQLTTAEQFVLWAFRQAAIDGPPADEVLTQGFALAFGDDVLAAALGGFEGLCCGLLAPAAGGPRHCPLACACIGVDEQRLLDALAALQLGDRLACARAIAGFVQPGRAAATLRHATVLALGLRRAGLALPDGRLVTLRRAAAAH